MSLKFSPEAEAHLDALEKKPVVFDGPRGFFCIGIERYKTGHNVGSLWRSASLYEATLMFTVGRPYGKGDCMNADTLKAYKHIPLMHFADPELLKNCLPRSTPLVGIELTDSAIWIDEFVHPERACYVLGSEDNGLSKAMSAQCHHIIKLPGAMSMNVACAGSIVMHDRWTKRKK